MPDKKTNRTRSQNAEKQMIGPNLSFASAEAYKMLRTNLMFSFPTDEKSHVIGVTSTFKGEGKSFTAINLAYTLAEAGQKVLLIEGDMRLPNYAGRLGIKAVPGLSNLMINMNSISGVIQRKVFQSEVGLGAMSISFDVLSAGSIPPNPSELIQSARMAKLIEALRQIYDYVIFDLPPITVVTDALIASKYTSGLLIVVRNDKASKKGVAESVRLCRQTNAKILGFVFTDADISKSYGRNYKKNYYKGYYK